VSLYTLDITERCNSDCVFCFAAPRYRRSEAREAPCAQVRAQLKAIRAEGHGGVCFTGGEPTTHPDLPGLVRSARRLKLSVVINTNGLRFADSRYLKALLPAKFSCVVSFHSHVEEVYDRITRTKSFREAVRGILNLLAAKVPVHLSHVLNRHNHSLFPGWVDYVNTRLLPEAEEGFLTAGVFFNQQVDGPERAMIEFKAARPFLLKGLRKARFPLEHKTSCTASDCLFEDGFFGKEENFREELRPAGVGRLKNLPLHLQKELLDYFIPERCCSCARFLAPSCRGIRKEYLLRFGDEEYPGLLSARERELVRGRGPLPSSPHLALSGQEPAALSAALTASFDPQLRREAARALVGSEGGDPALLQALRDPDPQTRRDAALALYKRAPPGSAASLAEALKDKDAEVRRLACLALLKLAPVPAAVPRLKKALSDPDLQVRRTAALALVSAKDAARALCRALKDEDLETRRNAAVTLAGLDAPPAAAPALAEALGDPDAQVRRAAAGALFKLERVPSSAAEALLAALESADPAARVAAGLGLSRMSPPPAKAVPALLARLSDGEAQVRRFALIVLSRLAPLPEAAAGGGGARPGGGGPPPPPGPRGRAF
jgi:HEAT repeat protein